MKNQFDDTSKTLTERWKKGELPEGEEYWVILTDEWYLRKPVEPVRAFYSCDCEFEGYYDDDIKEVLAPVPSYDEWKEYQELEEDYKKNVQLAIRFSIEADILKELLKEIRDNIAESQLKLTPEGFKLITEIVTKIDEVLK